MKMKPAWDINNNFDLTILLMINKFEKWESISIEQKAKDIRQSLIPFLSSSPKSIIQNIAFLIIKDTFPMKVIPAKLSHILSPIFIYNFTSSMSFILIGLTDIDITIWVVYFHNPNELSLNPFALISFFVWEN